MRLFTERQQWISRLLGLRAGESGRLLPFLALYGLLFAVLTIADGLATSLFVQRVGAAQLPRFYALTAVLNLLLIGVYMWRAERLGSVRTFVLILVVTFVSYGGAWLAIGPGGLDGPFYGLLFAAREVSYTLVLMHFGTFLQDYFTRHELNRVLPIVYSGGRLGGIAGGVLLEHGSALVGTVQVLGIAALLVLVAIAAVVGVARRCTMSDGSADERGDPGVRVPEGADLHGLEQDALGSTRGFLRFVRRTPLMYWTAVSALVYMLCRWILNYQYNSYFETHFTDDAEMAGFLGRYAQIALAGSLFMQLVVIGRLVRYFGLKGAQMTYAGLVMLGFGINAVAMSFPSAVFARVLESELRFGMRNPLNQLVTNKFGKAVRVRVRAFSLGALIPVSTLAVAGVLGAGLSLGLGAWVGALGVLSGASYVFASLRQNSSFEERPEAS